MRNNHPQKPQVAEHPLPESRPAWLLPAIVVVSAAIVALSALIVRHRFFPEYWVEEDIGPIATNTAPPPGPTPEGMAWIPGGTYWMGSDNPAFADARPIHKVYV